jgi:hypothetical protein
MMTIVTDVRVRPGSEDSGMQWCATGWRPLRSDQVGSALGSFARRASRTSG